jgi:autotransporter strand-loop-strand O-heptosyltransferase
MKGLLYKGKKIADKGYILNLPERTDRLESTKKLLDELGFEGYEVFSGIKFENPEFRKLGCTASYISLFENVVSSSIEDIVVFEDDIKLMNSTSKYDLDSIFNDWDEIKERYDVVALGTKLLPRTKIKVNGDTHGSYQEMLCTQSFYYKRPIIEHTYEQLKNFTHPSSHFYKCTIDMFLNDCSCEQYRFIHSDKHKKFEFGITIPMIFSQSSSYSDNEKREQDYDEIMEQSYFNALKFPKAYVLYSTENYLDIVTESVKSIREFSSLPVIVYMLNSDKVINVSNTRTVRWDFALEDLSDKCYTKEGDNFYIDRRNSDIYKVLIQRPLIVKDALNKHADTVCYVDSDSIATPNVDKIFTFFNRESYYPYFVEGIYEYMTLYGKGGVGGNDGGQWSDTLEHNACELFGVDQTIRKTYRQTGYFVAGQKTLDFIDEWYWMCNHPKIWKNINHYAPFNEETILNVLLWKNKIHFGLPYIYVNGSTEVVDEMYTKVQFKGENITNHIRDWVRAPQDLSHLLFFHGEKNPEKMRDMVRRIKRNQNKKLKVLYFAPHLSTGGMPAYLLKRIESISKFYPDVELYVVEFCLYASNYVVQRNKIKQLVSDNRFWSLNNLDNHSEENSMKLIDILKTNSIDIVHIDEIPEGFDSFNKISKNVLNALFDNSRTWRVVETCHNIWFDPKNLSFIPDGFAFCTPYHERVQFKDVKTLSKVFEFPIENKMRTGFEQLKAQEKLGLELGKVHVLNVGLWTQGKNQGEGVEIARLLEKTRPHIQFHFVGNQASNFENYWGPIMKNLPSNVKVWGEREDIDEFMKASDILMFNSTWECNPIVLREAASYGLEILARNLPQYFDMFTPHITPIQGDDVNEIKEQLVSLINKRKTSVVSENTSEKFAKDHIDFYKKLIDSNVVPQTKIPSNLHIIQYYIEQPYLELKGDSKSKFKIQFFDEKGVIHYENTLPVNSWVKLNRQYFTKWRTKIYEDKTLVLDRTLNYEGQRVFISFDSKSLGDSVSWIPYCLEFKKKHKCDVIVSTFWNKLFKNVYPELEFVEPGSVVHNIHGMYKLGWFWNKDREPEVPNTIPLQKAATNILGLDYTEIKPRIDYHISQKPYDGKYVTIATNSTAGCKFWTPEGWQELVDYLVSQGYRVVNVSKENNELKNVTKIKDVSIENTMNVIHHSEFFIGLSSGLSWLSWGMGKKVVMISNFTTADHEFTTDCIRITNPLVCNGCWNNPNFKFDKGDWNWCPVHKGTDRQFECHKSITSQMVIDKIQNLLK